MVTPTHRVRRSLGWLIQNRRIEQRKCVKFNHLVANCLIFYNVHVISEALQKLNQEGAELGERVVAALSPYIRQHINRFGRYQPDLTQPPPPLNYDIRVVTSKKKSAGFVASDTQKEAKAKSKKKKSARHSSIMALPAGGAPSCCGSRWSYTTLVNSCLLDFSFVTLEAEGASPILNGLLWFRQKAELLHHAHGILMEPFFDDLASCKAIDVYS